MKMSLHRSPLARSIAATALYLVFALVFRAGRILVLLLQYMLGAVSVVPSHPYWLDVAKNCQQQQPDLVSCE